MRPIDFKAYSQFKGRCDYKKRIDGKEETEEEANIRSANKYSSVELKMNVKRCNDNYI